LMYWQVYLHKTVLVAEKMLIKIIERVRAIYSKEDKLLTTNTTVDYFLTEFDGYMSEEAVQSFVMLDDFDFMHAIKSWSGHPDKILRTLCHGILDRKLLKIKLQADPFIKDLVQQKRAQACQQLGIDEDEANYLVFTGEAVNTMYKTSDERINILFKDGAVKDISQVDNALIHNTLNSTVKKFYICYYE
jgi:HD superfamily phosphohydrolase